MSGQFLLTWKADPKVESRPYYPTRPSHVSCHHPWQAGRPLPSWDDLHPWWHLADEIGFRNDRQLQRWVHSDAVKPFFDEFVRDFLFDEFSFPGVAWVRYEPALRNLLRQSLVVLRNDGRRQYRRLKRPDKSLWGLDEHCAWFAFQVWQKARSGRPGLCRWRLLERKDPREWCDEVYYILQQLQLEWLRTSPVARENWEEAKAAGRHERSLSSLDPSKEFSVTVYNLDADDSD
jgi:hypothetical protein